MNRIMFLYAVGLATAAGVLSLVSWQAAVTPVLCLVVICVDELCDALKDTK